MQTDIEFALQILGEQTLQIRMLNMALDKLQVYSSIKNEKYILNELRKDLIK